MRKILMEFTFKDDKSYYRFMDALGCEDDNGYIRVPYKCRIVRTEKEDQKRE